VRKMVWKQSDIEMSSWVAPNFVAPEGEGRVYILIHKSTLPRTTSTYDLGCTQQPSPAGLGLMCTRRRSPDLIRVQSRAMKNKWESNRHQCDEDQARRSSRGPAWSIRSRLEKGKRKWATVGNSVQEGKRPDWSWTNQRG
jgi:hypothetical protein